MKRALAIAALFAAGCAAALSLVSRASAWSPSDLPAGVRITHIISVGATYCAESYQFTAPAVSNPFCADSPTFQADFDAWVDGHYTAPTTTTQAALPPVTTTVIITTTTPSAAAPAPPDTSAAAPAPPPATSTVTVTTTVSAVEQSLQAQLDALSAQVAAITDRVTRLEKASDAAWLAYEQAIESGETPAAAADIARGTALNVIYGLGAFA